MAVVDGRVDCAGDHFQHGGTEQWEKGRRRVVDGVDAQRPMTQSGMTFL